MPVAEGLRDAARERDVAAAVNELAAGSGRANFISFDSFSYFILHSCQHDEDEISNNPVGN